MTPQIALCVTYYNQPTMLARQLAEWKKYAPHVRKHFRFVIVDDGSAVPAETVLRDYVLPLSFDLFRIDTDIPWNQHGARNLAAAEGREPWLLMLDIDHVLTAENAARIAQIPEHNDPDVWFKFPRERIGAADETRAKDATLRGIDPTVSRVPVNSAMNCYLMPRAMYWEAGGYNEDFCGTYGGDTQFLNEARAVAGDAIMLDDVWLQVHTRHSVPDANEATLDRDPRPFRERLAWAKRANMVKGHPPYCRFPWHCVL